MKKIAYTLLISALVTTGAYAKGNMPAPNACAYSDYYHIADDSKATPVIASLTGDDNIVLVQKGDNSFYIKDTAQCPADGGYAHVRYQKDGDNYCNLTIHDGANMWDPDVTAECHGNLSYAGMKYDGLRTYSYSLDFS